MTELSAGTRVRVTYETTIYHCAYSRDVVFVEDPVVSGATTSVPLSAVEAIVTLNGTVRKGPAGQTAMKQNLDIWLVTDEHGWHWVQTREVAGWPIVFLPERPCAATER